MSEKLRYIGTQRPFFETAITGKPTRWMPGVMQDVDDADVPSLVASGLFMPVDTNTIDSMVAITAAEVLAPSATMLSIASRLVTYVGPDGKRYRSNATDSTNGTALVELATGSAASSARRDWTAAQLQALEQSGTTPTPVPEAPFPIWASPSDETPPTTVYLITSTTTAERVFIDASVGTINSSRAIVQADAGRPFEVTANVTLTLNAASLPLGGVVVFAARSGFSFAVTPSGGGTAPTMVADTFTTGSSAAALGAQVVVYRQLDGSYRFLSGKTQTFKTINGNVITGSGDLSIASNSNGVKVGLGIPFSGRNLSTLSVSNTSAGNQGVGLFRGTFLDLGRSDYTITEVLAGLQFHGVAGAGSGAAAAYIYAFPDDGSLPANGTAPLWSGLGTVDITSAGGAITGALWKKWPIAGGLAVPRFIVVGLLHNCQGGNPNWVQANASAMTREGPAAANSGDDPPSSSINVLCSYQWTAAGGFGTTDTWGSGAITLAANQPVAWYVRRSPTV
jgi:hypothetical protein